MSEIKVLNIFKRLAIIISILMIAIAIVILSLLIEQLKKTKDQCKNDNISIEGQIKNIAADNNKLFIHVEDNGSEKILIFDYCLGEDKKIINIDSAK